MFKKLFFIVTVLCGISIHAVARPATEIRDSVKIYFRQGKIDLVPDLYSNQESLDRIADRMSNEYADSVYRLKRVEVVGAASPEGSEKFNKWLSEQRAGVLFDYLSRYGELSDSVKITTYLGRDWRGLIRMVEADSAMPARKPTLDKLNEIADDVDAGRAKGETPLVRIKKFRGGVPYRYMYRNFFPTLRASKIRLWYEKVKNEAYVAPEPAIPVVHDTVFITEYIQLPCPESPCSPFYMDVRTNMLYDLAAIPNIGVEFYLGHDLSIIADWQYGWWKTDRRHRYWRAYGGDLGLRWWFGEAADEKPLTGHHLGVYGQILTYDFEWGGKGYMGGKPGGTLWDKMHWGVGVEYGYSLPIARRLNLDFSLGIGYLGGTYYTYKPVDGCYVWQSTKKRNWFGPTKAEVSLVWLIGCDNFNRQKGGEK